ncbi:MAG TPA: hypothetical protein VMZ52_19700 [Bryobacteraceae bacterium]|nr:hypothetical protein [Bryobacteraceae bacterium]
MGSIQKLEQHLVFQAPFPPGRVVPFELRQVIHPRFPGLPCHFRVAHHQRDVLEVFGEGLPQETLHIFNQDCLRPQNANSRNGVGKKVAFILVAPMLPSKRPWLTRDASGQKIGAFANRAKVEYPNILLMERPFNERLNFSTLILPDRLARIGVYLDNGFVLKSGIGDAKGKAPNSSEQFNGSHRFESKNSSIRRLSFS